MFTSRAEYRLLLRQDNADLRLTEKGIASSLVSGERRSRFEQKSARVAELRSRLREIKVDTLPLERWLKRAENFWASLPQDVRAAYPADVWEQIETDLKYDGYLRRQEEQILRSERHEAKWIPDSVAYEAINGLRTEAAQSLAKIRPETLGQAARISGVTPADIALLGIWIARSERAR
jgi:tRNA uridine 5-carboxymethylaminomethyl modification enzyme